MKINIYLKRIFAISFIVVGLSLVLTVFVVLTTPLTTKDSYIVFGSIFIVISGLFGGNLKSWGETKFTEEKEPPQKIEVVVKDYSADKNVAEDDLKKMVDEYLDWVQETFGTIVLRGIERGGAQAVNLPLEEVYVPLSANILNDASEKSRVKALAGYAIEDNIKIESNKKRIETLMKYFLLVVRCQKSYYYRPVFGGSGKTTVLLHFASDSGKSFTQRSETSL